MTKFQYYPATVYAKEPLGFVTLFQFIPAIKSPKKEVSELLDKIQAEPDKKKRDSMKEQLFMFTPCAIFDGTNRGYDNITGFTNLLVAEYDNISHEESIYLKHRIFNDFSSCICAFLSPSGRGVKFLFQASEITSINDYKSLWWGLAYHLEQIKEGVDTCNERPSQVLYLSKDENILSRENYTTWTKRGGKYSSVIPFDGEYVRDKEPTEESTEQVKNIILKMLDNFDGNGHSTVLRISTLTGGFISGGEISYEDAEEFIFEQIDNHYYLQKKSSTYKKTTQRFLISGQNAPLTLDL